jgi:hypothetical protein
MRGIARLGVASALLTSCASSSLEEVRARPAEIRFPGVPASQQLEAARCIRDILDGSVGDDILQTIEVAADGLHVVGRLEESLDAAVFYDVAVREDAVMARRAAGSVVPAEMLRGAMGACLAPTGENKSGHRQFPGDRILSARLGRPTIGG